jgi:hypothetical protein
MLPKTQSISKETMGPSTRTDTKQPNRSFGTLRKKTLRKNVVVMLCVLGVVTFSFVSNGYSSMLAYSSMPVYVPESQFIPKTTPNTSVPDIKSDDSANSIGGAGTAPVSSAPVFVPDSALTANLSTNPDRVFWCGYNTLFVDLHFNLVKVLFPGVPAQKFNSTMAFGPNDLLILTRAGNCQMGKGVKKIQNAFPGKIMYVVGEVDGPDPHAHERIYSLGPLADSSKTLRSYFGAMVLAMYSPETQRKIFDPQFRVHNTKQKFVSYIASNCVQVREDAFRSLSTIGTVHYGGGCSGGLASGMSNENIQKSKVSGSWLRNGKGAKGVFQDYRFGLVMENAKSDGYITEKIVNAFLSGTVPIWYGTREIFDVFNERAFIYYDIDDPQPALDRIAYLEKNQTAYDELSKETILANGDQTIEDYFSFRDDSGGGKLKKRIRNMLGYQ